MSRPGAPGADANPQRRISGDDEPVKAAEDSARAWGDRADGNDDRLRRDVPPHWG